MGTPDTLTPPAGGSGQGRRRFKPGDLVVPIRGHPLLCEVLSVEEGGPIRIRGLEWPSGYSVLVRAEDYRLVTGRLSD